MAGPPPAFQLRLVRWDYVSGGGPSELLVLSISFGKGRGGSSRNSSQVRDAYQGSEFSQKDTQLRSRPAYALTHLGVGEKYSFDEESWKRLKTETLELFYTHGTEYLDVFAIRIKKYYELNVVVANPAVTFRRVDSAQRRVRIKYRGRTPGFKGGLPSLRAICRVRRLYQTIGWDPARKEVAGVLPVVDMVREQPISMFVN